MKKPAMPFPEDPDDRNESLISRVAYLQARIGPFSAPFDSKAFLDTEWEAPRGDFSRTDLASGKNTEGGEDPLDLMKDR